MSLSIDHYILSHPEPIQGCLLFIRNYILSFHPNFGETLKYGIPFFTFKNKNCCYLSVNKNNIVYLGFIHGKLLKHPKLKKEGRKMVKVYYLNPEQDIDIQTLNELFHLNITQIESLIKK
ncbi:MAG: DUF1801 domain-containing protein [Sphingobacteriaceae bacterium]|nr:DUF1801 domain-containing protein [Sphingobacteriaceae bacterium]